MQQLLSRYGFLESVHFQKGKTNMGFAKYKTAESCLHASASLDGMEIAEGIVAKVCIANPQEEGRSMDPNPKRQRLM
jgi:hypothetical protein